VKILFNNNEMKVRRKFWESYDYGIKILYSFFSVNFKLSGTYKRKRSCPFSWDFVIKLANRQRQLWAR
jgi:hypothetical protein